MTSPSFEFINERYLSGISDEPKQLLQPIFGYAREPLTSLEEACEPLLSIVPRLPAHIWIAKQNSKNPADGLTQDESASIRLYTMEWDASADEPRASLYVHLNQTLKQIDRTKLRPWFRYLKLFLTALAKLPPAPRQTVWRGVHKNFSDDYPPNTEATWWAFSSCTTSLSVLESDLYLGSVGTRTLFSIETFNGRLIRAHSHFTTEDEILLLPGTYFIVKSRLNPAPDLYIIHLIQKQPPFDLLEPPFEGAELVPPSEPRLSTRTNMDIKNDHVKDIYRPWYKKNIVRFVIAPIIIAAIILAIILGAVLRTRANSQPSTSVITSTPSVNVYLNGLVPNPVSIADAFYAFDNNILDLYSRRNGKVIGGSVSYYQGYVAYGEAIALDQSIATQIQMQPGFNLTTSTSFTVEGFFLLQRTQLYAILVQLTPTITMNLTNGMLSMSLGSNIIISGTTVLGTEQWHQFSFVYDATQLTANIYIDGSLEASRTSVKPEIVYSTSNSSIIVGAGFQGYIDQLSIILKAKSSVVTLWDATVGAYYPLDLPWSPDKGPNGLNGTAANVLSTIGWLRNCLNFNLSGANFQASGFTALGLPRHAFSIALWVRAEAQAGIFLTVANPYTCLLVFGLQNNTNRLFVYLPNATASGNGVNIFGAIMPPYAWAHVAFTWSVTNLAQLYASGSLINSASDATTLNNVRGDNNSLPMTVTLGRYNGTANCQGIAGINSSPQFMGSLDEVYIFARELHQSDIQQILTP